MVSCTACLLGYVFIVAAAHTSHIVGGSIGWTIPPSGFSYDQWAATQTFMAGNSLLFNSTSTFNSSSTNNEAVAEVFSKADYDSCSTPGAGTIAFYFPIALTIGIGPGEHYYFSPIGQHCRMNKKFTINVTGSPPTSSTSSFSSLTVANLFLLLLSTLIAFFY